MTSTVTALIIDDEPLARKKIRELIASVPWLECVGEVGDGATAVSAIDEQQPDLVFLDIRMPRLSGLEILRRVKHVPAVIFTTAYDQYAVTAFELAAIDYLLKPFGRERLLRAIERVRSSIGPTAASEAAARTREAFSAGVTQRLFVREAGRVIPLRVADIVRLEAADDFVIIHTATHRYRMGVPLQQVEQRLDPQQFIRVHRSHIVNMDHVATLTPYDGSRFQVRLRNGTEIVASRQCSRALRELERT
jgi:two-component system, LytTR family, response regulator